MDLLDDLGPRLRALSADQPAQPGDRVPAVTRTARRIRRTRVAVAVTAGFALLAPAGLLVSSTRNHERTSFAHSDVRTWADRSLPADLTVADGALAAVRQNAGMPVEDVRWLYRGRVPLPDHNPAYLAVFTATLQAQPVLFTATSVGTELDAQGRSASDINELPWGVDRVALDDGQALDHVGTYFGYSTEGQFHNLAVLLADPRARTMTWDSDPIPYAPQITGGASPTPARSSNGVFVTLLGPLTGPVTATVSDEDGHHLTYPLASGRSQAELLKSTAPDLPPGSQFIAGGSAESEHTANGSWTMPALYSDATDWPQAKRTVYIRCYGGGEVLVALTRDEPGPALRSGRVACDNVSRRAFVPVEISGHASNVLITPDRLQAITFTLVGVD